MSALRGYPSSVAATSLEPVVHQRRQGGRMAECFYCGTDAKHTRAHLLHQRIRAALQNESMEVTLGSSRARSGGLDRDLLYSGDVREIYVKPLCGQCNSLWMEPIEQAAGPILESIMRGRGVPQPRDLFRLAHWSTVVGALATQTGSRFDVAVEHRRIIRFTTTGQPRDFGTHFIWTGDTYPGAQFDFMRFEIGPGTEQHGVSWYSALHAGPACHRNGRGRSRRRKRRESAPQGWRAESLARQPKTMGGAVASKRAGDVSSDAICSG